MENSAITKPPHKDPTKYCRLCLSLANLRVLKCLLDSRDPVRTIQKQLGIELGEHDFPCALCAECVDKLEELYIYNDDGLLDEWEDQGLREFQKNCRSANEAIRNGRLSEQTIERESTSGEIMNTVILPFQQTGDGRYRCNDCSNVMFDTIAACITHCQENHPNSVSALHAKDVSANALTNSKKQFKCRKCAIQFGTMVELNAHRKTHNVSRNAKRSNQAPENRSFIPPVQNSGKKPCMKCINCSETFDNIDELIKHRTTVHPEKMKRQPKRKFIIDANSTTCKACHVEFKDKKSFYMHVNVKHDQNICYVCDRSFPSPSTLVKHHSYHRNLDDIINPYLQGRHSYHCKVCFEKFRTEGDIRLHFELKHANMEDMLTAVFENETPIETDSTMTLRVTCTKCYTSFSSNEHFAQHMDQCIALPNQNPEEDLNGGGTCTESNDTSDAAVLRITCTRCFTSFGSDEQFEQHQTNCVVQPEPQLSETETKYIVEISDEEIVSAV